MVSEDGTFEYHSGPALRLERGGERMVVTGRTKTGISRLRNKIYRYMIHQKIAYFQAFREI